VREFLRRVEELTGSERYLWAPTLCWLDSSDLFLGSLCGAGVVLAVCLLIGLTPRLVLFALWAIYLSLTVAGQDFLSYQWDALLLETTFLAIFLAPGSAWPRLRQEQPPARLILWLLSWLLFRLMMGSGVAKLASGDPTWRDFSALQFHYESQPLPTWVSWYMHQLPAWFQKTSVGFVFVVELILPVLTFGPRRYRLAACVGFVTLQILIAATGNYGFFNLLTVALCILLLDDNCFPPWLRRRYLTRQSDAHPSGPRQWLAVSGAAAIFLCTLVPLWQQFIRSVRLPSALESVAEVVSSLRTFNRYGLFAVMTTERREIEVEGSNDGQHWMVYAFRWKPGPLQRTPTFMVPHMPRLDWQMWFAALANYQRNPWFVHFLGRLLRGEPDVLALLSGNPFPGRPPQMVRALIYNYRFTSYDERQRTGCWWHRELLGSYCPVLTLHEQDASETDEAQAHEK
jgi:hypothetical protein